MLNINESILDKLTSDECFLLLHIARFMRQSDCKAFPSIATLVKNTGFSKKHVIKLKRDLVNKNMVSVEQRMTESKGFMSNLYTIETDDIGIFISLKGKKSVESTHKGSVPPSQGVVTDVHKGSVPPSQGVVTDVHTNKLASNNKLLNEQISQFEQIREKEETHPQKTKIKQSSKEIENDVVKNTAAANYNQSAEKVIVELPPIAKEEKYDNRDAVRNVLVQILQEDENWLNGMKLDCEFSKITWIDENQNAYIMALVDFLFKEGKGITPLSKNQLKDKFRASKWIVTRGNDLVKQNSNNQTQFSKNGSNAYQTGAANNGKPKHHRLTNRIDELCEAVLGQDSNKRRENGTDIDPFDSIFNMYEAKTEQAEYEEVS